MSSAKPLRLPPNFTEDRFSEFISRAGNLCGHENIRIVSSAEELVDGDYMNPCKAHDMHAIYDRDFFVASAVICPRDVPNVQGIVRLANEFCVPIWPYSAGRNTGYGGSAPRVSGSIALDLGTQMNKVLDVNIDGAFALVEPGVTFMQLHDYLEENNLRDHLWLDVPDLGGGSIIGISDYSDSLFVSWAKELQGMQLNVAWDTVCLFSENKDWPGQLTYKAPYGDHWMMHCGLEIILPNGELIRTGMGALPEPGADKSLRPDEQKGNRCWQLFNYGFGPYNDGIFTQSSLGIIVKMGIWVGYYHLTLMHYANDVQLMPNPGGYQAYMITFPRDDDLSAIVDTIRPLRLVSTFLSLSAIRKI